MLSLAGERRRQEAWERTLAPIIKQQEDAASCSGYWSIISEVSQQSRQLHLPENRQRPQRETSEERLSILVVAGSLQNHPACPQFLTQSGQNQKRRNPARIAGAAFSVLPIALLLVETTVTPN